MWTLLNPRLWIAAVLAAVLAVSHFSAYRAGSASVRQKWDAQITMQAQATLKASEAARTQEQLTATKLRKANDDLQIEKKRRAADAVAAADGLRDFRATLYGIAPGNPARPAGTLGTGGLERDLFADCAKAITDLGHEADRLAGKVVGLQDYVRATAPK